jgi:hypothetical protein
MPVQPADQFDQGSCPAFVQVSIQTPADPAGFCAHHYDHLRRARRARLRPHQAHRGPETSRWIGSHHQQEPRSDPDHQARKRCPEAALGLFAEEAPGWKRIMRRLTASLAAVAAAAGLVLIPLAAASSASAATTSTPSGHSFRNWSGYVDTADHPSVKMEMARTLFTVPKINCAKSVIGPHEAPVSFRKTHGNDWSAVSFWAGLDGEKNTTTIEQAGVEGICHSKTSAAVYLPFYQVDAYTNVQVKMGTPIEAGDVIEAYVSDYVLESPGIQTGYKYYLYITDETQGGENWTGIEKVPARAPDGTAEVVTEAVSNGPYATKALAPDGAIGLAAFSPVTYTEAGIASSTSGGAWPMTSESPWWTLQEDYVGIPVTLITTGKLGTTASGYSEFTNTFR